jgi:hypothetical protein
MQNKILNWCGKTKKWEDTNDQNKQFTGPQTGKQRKGR